MPVLEPCPGCQRHVRSDEQQCPFCGVAVAAHMATQRPRTMPRARLSRAALFAFGIGAVGTPLLACNGDDDDNNADGGQAGDGDQDHDAGGGGIQPVYGVPPGDGDGSGDGELLDAGMVGGDGDGFDGGWGIPIYGAAPMVVEKK